MCQAFADLWANQISNAAILKKAEPDKFHPTEKLDPESWCPAGAFASALAREIGIEVQDVNTALQKEGDLYFKVDGVSYIEKTRAEKAHLLVLGEWNKSRTFPTVRTKVETDLGVPVKKIAMGLSGKDDQDKTVIEALTKAKKFVTINGLLEILPKDGTWNYSRVSNCLIRLLKAPHPQVEKYPWGASNVVYGIKNTPAPKENPKVPGKDFEEVWDKIHVGTWGLQIFQPSEWCLASDFGIAMATLLGAKPITIKDRVGHYIRTNQVKTNPELASDRRHYLHKSDASRFYLAWMPSDKAPVLDVVEDPKPVPTEPRSRELQAVLDAVAFFETQNKFATFGRIGSKTGLKKPVYEAAAEEAVHKGLLRKEMCEDNGWAFFTVKSTPATKTAKAPGRVKSKTVSPLLQVVVDAVIKNGGYATNADLHRLLPDVPRSALESRARHCLSKQINLLEGSKGKHGPSRPATYWIPGHPPVQDNGLFETLREIVDAVRKLGGGATNAEIMKETGLARETVRSRGERCANCEPKLLEWTKGGPGGNPPAYYRIPGFVKTTVETSAPEKTTSAPVTKVFVPKGEPVVLSGLVSALDLGDGVIAQVSIQDGLNRQTLEFIRDVWLPKQLNRRLNEVK